MFRRAKSRQQNQQGVVKNSIEEELAPSNKISPKQPKSVSTSTRNDLAKKTKPNREGLAGKTFKNDKHNPKKYKLSQAYEIYVAKAKEAQTLGDYVLSEQYYQQADHYSRLMREK